MSVHNSALSNLHHGLQKVIRDKGWKDGLSDIQLKAIPIVMAGHDCIIEAPTAGGKTEAVFFPTLTRAALNVKRSVQVLYLAPLRALLNNVEGRAEEYAHACGLHAFKWHGDVEQEKKIKEFRAPSQLMLTTPESLEAILLRKAGWTRFFSGLEVVICDEAHNFASGDRGGHLLTLLERLKHALGKNFQRIALTATIGNPDEMLRWLAGSNEKPGKRIHVTSNNPVENDYTIHFFDQAMDEEVPPEIKSHIRELKVLYKLLPNRKSIVFGRSRAKTEALAAAIGKMNQLSNARVPVKVRTHHSSVSKFYREEAETLIKASSETGLQAIISTSTLELGIDIGALDLVIQAGSLVSPGAFLQRVGRTGRRAGKKKFFRGLCTERAELVLLSAVVNLGLKHISESLRFAKRAYHLLAHQLICLCLQNRGIEPAAAWNILSAAYCFSDISRTEFLELIDFMVQQEYFRYVDDQLIVGEKTEKIFLGSNWRRLFAAFDSAPMFEVIEGKKQVGTLDSSFVESMVIPFWFVLGGIEWKAEKVNIKTKQVIAKRTSSGEAPNWFVFRGSDVPLETAKEAGQILFGSEIPYFLDDEGMEGLSAEKSKHGAIDWRDGKWIVALSEAGRVYIWTFAGDRINRTLALLLALTVNGKVAANYKYVEVQPPKKERKTLPGKIFDLLREYKQMELTELQETENELSKSWKRYEFSKFSKCLPDQLWGGAMAERTLDIVGLKRELENSSISLLSL